ncbi:MAG: methyltransferase [Algoriphagus sp. 32-45-6]|nr:MAG: methyltransferase [Algoriphagus sp. 32-45-6]
MGNSWFQFQQFRIDQDRCAMKISTDAILLGALANAEKPNQILDIGTGTGVIALMLAQRFAEAKVTAVELDSDAASQAQENISQSPFGSRMNLCQGRIQDFSPDEKFDLIVSNPPYFPDHLKSSDSKRNQALHTDSLSFEELIDRVLALLNPDGKFWLILPPRQMEDFADLDKKSDLKDFRRISVRDRADKPIFRVVGGFSKAEKTTDSQELILKDSSGNYTSAYKNLLSGFLLGY